MVTSFCGLWDDIPKDHKSETVAQMASRAEDFQNNHTLPPTGRQTETWTWFKVEIHAPQLVHTVLVSASYILRTNVFGTGSIFTEEKEMESQRNRRVRVYSGFNTGYATVAWRDLGITREFHKISPRFTDNSLAYNPSRTLLLYHPAHR